MNERKSFFQQHPVPTYYILTFVISWGAVLAVILARGIPADQEQVNAILPVAILAMLGGPLLGTILSTLLVDGGPGLAALFARLRNWRAGAGWWAFALLVGPAVLVAVPFLLSLVNPVYLPTGGLMGVTAQTLFMGIFSGLLVGFCEELGWTGFVTPRLRQRHSVVVTGLLMGVLWGAWHIMANGVLGMRTSAGDMSPGAFLAVRSLMFMIGWLVPFRVLIVWVHDHTRSLPLAMLMHAGVTAASIIFTSPVVGADYVLFDVTLGAAMWIVLVVVAAASRGRLGAVPG